MDFKVCQDHDGDVVLYGARQCPLCSTNSAAMDAESQVEELAGDKSILESDIADLKQQVEDLEAERDSLHVKLADAKEDK